MPTDQPRGWTLTGAAKTPFWNHFFKNDCFAKTGSGQTCDKLKKESTPFAAGGHSSHGAPGAGYGVHSVAATVEACRSNPSGFYVTNTNGGRITTQGYGLYSCVPFAAPRFRMPHPQTYQALIDAAPRPVFV
eukprot:COSAG06_NODE_3603_length_5131_cov_5.927862_6_plen_132_part_00